jgi:hypothetical protein
MSFKYADADGRMSDVTNAELNLLISYWNSVVSSGFAGVHRLID